MTLIPDHIMKAILGRPRCDLCGDPVLTEGRTRHVICELVVKEES